MRTVRRGTLAVLLLAGTACSDAREALVRQHMADEIAKQSDGALALTQFAKTNGVERVLGGEKLYSLEWTADVTVQEDVWKGGNAIEGYWSSFSVMRAQPDMWGNLLTGGNAREYVKGATVTLIGEAQLQLADNGWRVLGSNVSAFKVANNVRTPAAQAERQRLMDSVRSHRERLRVQAESLQAAETAAAAAAAEKAQAEKDAKYDALVAAARNAPVILGRGECTENAGGSGDRFGITEYRRYRFVVTSASISWELVGVTARGGQPWTKVDGRPEMLWFDEMSAKPGYFRGSRSSLDRVIILTNPARTIELYCSGSQDRRTPADELQSVFNSLSSAIESWKKKNTELARW
jgi:hypothetical protein